MIDNFRSTAKSWRSRIARIRYSQGIEFTQATIAKALKWPQSKVSRVCRANINHLKICDFCAVEGFIAQKEQEFNLKPMENNND